MTNVANQRITDIPTVASGKALRGYHITHRVFLWQIETARGYTCYECGEPVAGGLPHTFLRYLVPDSNGYDHHHMHNQCARDKWMPPHGLLLGGEVIPFRKVPLRSRGRKAGE